MYNITNIFIGILFIVVIILIYKIDTLNKELFTTSTIDSRFTDSIKLLSDVANELINNGSLTTPGSLKIEQNLDVMGNINFLPDGCIIAYNKTDNIPYGWAPCDGRVYKKSIYNIGNLWSNNSYDTIDALRANIVTTNIPEDHWVQVPNLSDRFLLGYDKNHTSAEANKDIMSLGGNNIIDISNIPKHKHQHSLANGVTISADQSFQNGTGPHHHHERPTGVTYKDNYTSDRIYTSDDVQETIQNTYYPKYVVVQYIIKI